MPVLAVRVLNPSSPELAQCAAWRCAQFGALLQTGVEAEWASLKAFTADTADQAALLATLDGAPAGTCLLVRSELEPVHALTPWLAGLYVAPDFRRHGVGAALVGAVEHEARRRGYRALFLYTREAAAYYGRLGWAVRERLVWKGRATALMARDVVEPGL